MTPGNLLTLFKCGCLTGILWSLSQMVLVIVINEFGLLTRNDLQSISGNWYFLADTLSGVLAITFYAVMRAAAVSIPRAMIVTVFVWLFIHTLVSGGFEYTIPLTVLASLLSVITMSLSLLAGVWPYEVLKSGPKQTAPSAS
ncbi:MAG: hypothetical protein KJN90_00890 [Gammaproteobacteria bacterium]|nr:hypothetical protein [Gammaproteobacteria bacterium]